MVSIPSAGAGNHRQPGSKLPGLALLIVRLLGVAYLLKSVAFLAIWFVVLWLTLRWNTQRRVNRLLSQWATTAIKDPSLSLAQATLDWMDDLARADPPHGRTAR